MFRAARRFGRAHPGVRSGPVTFVNAGGPFMTWFPHLRLVSLGTVGSMTTCQVLRCQAAGTEIATGNHRLNEVHEAVICVEHRQQIQQGAIWDVHDFGQVLIGQDMPPALKGWSVRDSIGTEGFTLELETATANSKSFEVFITPDAAQRLHTLLDSRRRK